MLWSVNWLHWTVANPRSHLVTSRDMCQNCLRATLYIISWFPQIQYSPMNGPFGSMPASFFVPVQHHTGTSQVDPLLPYCWGYLMSGTECTFDPKAVQCIDQYLINSLMHTYKLELNLHSQRKILGLLWWKPLMHMSCMAYDQWSVHCGRLVPLTVWSLAVAVMLGSLSWHW